MVVASNLPKAVKEKVDRKVEAGECLCCTNPAGDRRGLCGPCYSDFRAAYFQQPLKDRRIWEEKQIRLGRVLRSRQGQRRGKRNIFLSGR